MHRIRQLPNALSIARIAATPLLAWLALTGQEGLFTWVLIPALLSDIADGLIARLCRLESELGALLDSIADLLLLVAAGFGIWQFHPQVVLEHRWACGALAVAWCIEMLASLARYGRLSSFHTYAAKIAGYLLGIFVGVLFLWGFQPWLFYAAIGVSVLGNIEEIILLALLRQRRSDVRGVYWLLRERRRGAVAS